MTSPSEEAAHLRDQAGVRRLDEVSAIRVWGPDARSWLNGQITNQVALLEPGDAVYALAVTVKGRIVSDLWALGRGTEELLLLVPADRRDTLLAHFDRYIVMEDVEVEATNVVVLTVQGPAAAEVVGDRPSFLCARIGSDGRDVVSAPEDAAATLAALVASAEALGGGAVGRAGWELARLRAARPAYPADFDETTYPQEAGIKALAVSFDKGCYLGQEVVCMLESRGQLRRHLAQLTSAEPPTVGGDVLAGEKKVGEVRSTALDPDREAWLSLAYVKRAHASPGTALEAGGAAAEVLAIVGN